MRPTSGFLTHKQNTETGEKTVSVMLRPKRKARRQLARKEEAVRRGERVSAIERLKFPPQSVEAFFSKTMKPLWLYNATF